MYSLFICNSVLENRQSTLHPCVSFAFHACSLTFTIAGTGSTLMSPEYKTSSGEIDMNENIFHALPLTGLFMEVFKTISTLLFHFHSHLQPQNFVSFSRLSFSRPIAFVFFLYLFFFSFFNPLLWLSHTHSYMHFLALTLPVFGHRGAEWWTLLVQCKRPASVSLPLFLSVATVL